MIYDVVELSDSDVSKEEDHRGRRKGAWGNFCKVGGLSPPTFSLLFTVVCKVQCRCLFSNYQNFVILQLVNFELSNT